MKVGVITLAEAQATQGTMTRTHTHTHGPNPPSIESKSSAKTAKEHLYDFQVNIMGEKIKK